MADGVKHADVYSVVIKKVIVANMLNLFFYYSFYCLHKEIGKDVILIWLFLLFCFVFCINQTPCHMKKKKKNNNNNVQMIMFSTEWMTQTHN